MATMNRVETTGELMMTRCSFDSSNLSAAIKREWFFLNQSVKVSKARNIRNDLIMPALYPDFNRARSPLYDLLNSSQCDRDRLFLNRLDRSLKKPGTSLLKMVSPSTTF